MISHRYKCIFIEVPKTGSTSIRAIIGEPPRPHQNIWQIKHELENCWTRYGGVGNKILASCYLLLPLERRQAIGRDLFNRYLKFGFVRNPWDRAVSLYERREGQQVRDKMTFEQFVTGLKYSSSTCIHPMPHRNQLDWFVDPDGRVLVDFIGRFENIEEDWAFIARKLGVQTQVPHLNLNPARTKPYTAYYTPRTRQIIGERFKEDIDYFGYEFEAETDADRRQKLGCERVQAHSAPGTLRSRGSPDPKCPPAA
ncbi:MAG TPA: sulfotransferase family protein [Candidatus Limnocylindrales bacterium]|jgi:hypothetical protein|nr:sulfotransferase family protein [Candidatus Limnocylindrales bacterium]